MSRRGQLCTKRVAVAGEAIRLSRAPLPPRRSASHCDTCGCGCGCGCGCEWLCVFPTWTCVARACVRACTERACVFGLTHSISLYLSPSLKHAISLSLSLTHTHTYTPSPTALRACVMKSYARLCGLRAPNCGGFNMQSIRKAEDYFY